MPPKNGRKVSKCEKAEFLEAIKQAQETKKPKAMPASDSQRIEALEFRLDSLVRYLEKRFGPLL